MSSTLGANFHVRGKRAQQKKKKSRILNIIEDINKTKKKKDLFVRGVTFFLRRLTTFKFLYTFYRRNLFSAKRIVRSKTISF